MALLKRTAKSLGGFNSALALLALATAAGCVLMDALWPGEAGFSHRLHGDVGLHCVDCHGAGDDPAPAQVEGCLACHDDEQDVPRRERAVAVMDRMPRRELGSDDVIFAHLTHLATGLDCVSCHAELVYSTTIDRSRPVVDMAACVSCHKGEAQAPDDCAGCHREITEELAPAGHAHSWERLHGQVVRSGSERTVDNCALCHQRSSCTECHSNVEPASHNNTFRMRTHGVVAAIDRERCEACHRPDSCISCHEDTRPLSHRGSFGNPRNTHCVSCHLPLQTNSCNVCHKGTPSHATATPVPPDHSLVWNCRQCHGAGQPLPHVDNGSSCVSCHH